MSLKILVMAIAGSLSLAVLQGCSDLGTDPPTPPVTPVIFRVQPDSAAIGDTLTIVGSHFGSMQSSSTVHVGGVVADAVLFWSDSTILVRVPHGLSGGTIVVTVSGAPSNVRAFLLHDAIAPVSFSTNILPIFLRNGCLSCHGGLGGLEVGSVAQLLRGGDHGPVIVPGNAAASHIIQKLSPNPPFGSRMPLGGALPDSTVQVIRNWINQGALNN